MPKAIFLNPRMQLSRLLWLKTCNLRPLVASSLMPSLTERFSELFLRYEEGLTGRWIQ